MIIRRMTADFGNLAHQTLELKPGLNIIEAPNEYGKSTWCAFLRAMLYGVDTTARSKGGSAPEKNRYAPWSGVPMSGAIDLTWEGREITLRRSTADPRAPLREFSAVYTGTGIPVPELTDTDTGEKLTGLPRPVFDRTAFITSGDMAVRQSPELEKKIASLATAGEEDSSYSEAAARLRALQRRCSYRGRGRLPELEEEAHGLRRQLSAIGETANALDRVETAEEKTVLLLDSLRRDAPVDPFAGSRERELNRLLAERKVLTEQADRLEQRTEEAWASLRRGFLAGEKPDETLRKKTESDALRASELRRTARSGRGTLSWLWVACLGLATVLALLRVFGRGFLLASALLALLGGALGIAAGLASRDRKKAERSLKRILARYGADKPEDIPAALQEYERQWAAAEDLSDRMEALRTRLEDSRRREAELQLNKSAQTPDPRITEAEEKLSRLRESGARLRGRLDTLGDAMVLRSQLSALEQESRGLQRRMDALEIALEELTGADEEMQRQFAPALSRTAAEVFQTLTGGAYRELDLDRELTALVRREAEVNSRKETFLSQGTRDQLYLALRMALCELIPAGEEPCPIILDDALVRFDDKRMGYALDYLQQLSRYRQILLFTCQSRERTYMEKKK